MPYIPTKFLTAEMCVTFKTLQGHRKRRSSIKKITINIQQ